MIFYARLSKKFFYYAVKYAQFIYDLIPVRDLQDTKNGLPCTPYQLINNCKPNVRHYRVFGCPTIFKRYEISDSGKRIKNKYITRYKRNFCGIPRRFIRLAFLCSKCKKNIYITRCNI